LTRVSPRPHTPTADSSLFPREVRRTGEVRLRPSRTTTTPLFACKTGAAEINLRADSSGTSDSQYAIVVEREKAARRNALYTIITKRQRELDRVVGAMHQYVGERYQELRFGSAVETAFQVVRQEVDAEIGGLVPDALPMITAAFENAPSDNPEHWQNAASTCRRLLMTAADRLRPSGPDVDGRRMGPGNYVNRLVDWVVSRAESETAATMIAADLEFLGARLDAADGAGQKGAHVGPKPVTWLDASRYVTGTYLLLGDLLRTQSIRCSKCELVSYELNAQAQAGTQEYASVARR
jgi:hypothetical protein